MMNSIISAMLMMQITVAFIPTIKNSNHHRDIVGKLNMANKFLHAIINVDDIQKAQDFYTGTFSGLRISEHQDTKFSILQGRDEMLALKLQAAEVPVKQGNGFVGVGIRTVNPIDAMDVSFMHGGKVVTDYAEYAYGAAEIPDEDDLKQTPVRYGRLQDIDGYKIEVMENTPNSVQTDGIQKVVIGVLDLNDSIDFYTRVLKMKLLKRRSNVNNIPKSASMCAYCGYESETTGPFIELLYTYATDKVDVGTGLDELVFGTTNIAETRTYIESVGWAIIKREDGKFVELLDPNGVKIRIQQLKPSGV